MLIRVLFSDGCIIEQSNVINAKAFWRKISKYCKRENARVERVIKSI